MPTVDPPIFVSEGYTMTPVNEDVLGSQIIIFGDGSSNVQERSLRNKVVECGPIVQGDHKAPNPWSYAIDEEFFAVGSFIRVIPDRHDISSFATGGFMNNNTDLGRVILPPSLKLKAYNAAVDKLGSKVRGTLDLSVAVAELGSTKRMLKITSGLTSTVEGLAQRKLHLVKRVTREVSGRYLEWKYGWSPLLSDIYGAADESLRYVLNKVQKVRATATIPYPVSMKRDLALEGLKWKTQNVVQGKAACAIELEFHDSNILDRWASLNPASIAWEILPYSFVADWFFDVGSFLRNTETGFLYRKNFVKGFVSELDVRETAASINESKKSFGETVTLRGSARRKSLTFSRSLLDTYPFPRLPSWEADLGSSQLLSAAALLSQFLNYSPQVEHKSKSNFRSKTFGVSFWERRASNLLLRHGLVR